MVLFIGNVFGVEYCEYGGGVFEVCDLYMIENLLLFLLRSCCSKIYG